MFFDLTGIAPVQDQAVLGTKPHQAAVVIPGEDVGPVTAVKNRGR